MGPQPRHEEPSGDSAQSRQSVRLTSGRVDPSCQQDGRKRCLSLRSQTEGDLSSSVLIPVTEDLDSIWGR